MNIKDYTDHFDPQDIADNKGISCVCYLGIFLLIPLLTRKNSYFVKFHANQGLLLLILSVCFNVVQVVVNAIFRIIGFGFISGILGGVFTLLSFLVFGFMIWGIYNAANGKAKELPVIGSIKLIK